jgi:hypothetical protein
MEIRHPEWLQIKTNNKTYFGYDQEWYHSIWQRKAGCGPTAAAMLLNYTQRREGILAELPELTGIIAKMEDCWQYVTPGTSGVSTTNKLCNGLTKFFDHYQLSWRCEQLSINPKAKKTIVTLAKMIDFIANALENDCPLGFLSLHPGKIENLQRWHWTVLVRCNHDPLLDKYIATVYDGGDKIEFDIGLWLTTTATGGGFVHISKDL